MISLAQIALEFLSEPEASRVFYQHVKNRFERSELASALLFDENGCREMLQETAVFLSSAAGEIIARTLD